MRKLSRKVKEAVLADRLERKYSKDQILQAYLNTIYLGNGAYGVEAAANIYFNEHASQSEPAPGRPAGRPHPEPERLRPHPRAGRGQDPTGGGARHGWCTMATSRPPRPRRPTWSPLPTSVVEPPAVGDEISDYYVQEVQTELLAPGSPLGGTYDQRYETLFEGGLKIYTNLNPTLQATAEQTVASDTPANNRGFQQAMVTIDPATGKVLAMVGGEGVQSSRYDIVTQGTRQAGLGLQALHPARGAAGGLFDLRHAGRPVTLRHRLPHRP